MKHSFVAAIFGATLATGAYAEGQTHYLAVQVNQNDPAVMNMALNNVENVTSYYESIGDKVVIEIVAYGPGLNMYVAGKSPVAERISVMSLGMDNVSFAACGNTHRKMSKKAGKDVVLLEEAGMVTSGVVRLMELQSQDYAYVRP